GAVDIEPDGSVNRLQEKQGGDSGWINAGIYLIARKLIDEIPSGPSSLEREWLPRWLEQESKVFGYCHVGPFLDIGTPESYAEAKTIFRQSMRRAAGLIPAVRLVPRRE